MLRSLLIGSVTCAVAMATAAPAAPAAAVTPAAGPPALAPAAASSPEPGAGARANVHPRRPRTGLYYNEPRLGKAGAHVRRLYIDRFRQAGRGSLVRVMMWSVTDAGVEGEVDVLDAVRGAHRRGATIRVIGSQANCGDFRSRFGFLRRDGRSGTWVRCVRDHGMHQKSVTFSRVGGARYVTLVGSSNMALANWQDQWNDMYQYVGRKDVHRWYAARFDRIARNFGRPASVPYQKHSGRGDRVNFLPVNDASPTRHQDPVWDRLRGIPANPGGNRRARIDIAVYAMDAERGAWLVDMLLGMKARGAVIRFVAGPYVRDHLSARLRAGGIPVVNGYVRGCSSPGEDTHCNFVHLKMMTARYYEGGRWNHRSYTGSANWSMEGLTRNFEAMQRIDGRAAHAAYQQLFGKIWRGFRDHWS